MMRVDAVLGIGVDIEKVSRFKKAMKKRGFQDKIFTKREICYCKRFSCLEAHLAARFAAKEAVIKALGGLGKGLGLDEIEILNRQSGAPFVNMKKKRLKKNLSYYISLSHSNNSAIAFSVITEKVRR